MSAAGFVLIRWSLKLLRVGKVIYKIYNTKEASLRNSNSAGDCGRSSSRFKEVGAVVPRRAGHIALNRSVCAVNLSTIVHCARWRTTGKDPRPVRTTTTQTTNWAHLMNSKWLWRCTLRLWHADLLLSVSCGGASIENRKMHFLPAVVNKDVHLGCKGN